MPFAFLPSETPRCSSLGRFKECTLGLITVDADDGDKVDAQFAMPDNCVQLSCLPFTLSVGEYRERSDITGAGELEALAKSPEN